MRDRDRERCMNNTGNVVSVVLEKVKGIHSYVGRATPAANQKLSTGFRTTNHESNQLTLSNSRSSTAKAC